MNNPQNQRSSAQYKQGYSSFIRRTRLVLPIVAVILIAIVFSWPNMGRNQGFIIEDIGEGSQNAASNALINPRFESVDPNNQPYTIIAQRAVQSQDNENLVLLDKPSGDMTMSSGHWLAVEADKGAYKQSEQQFLLQDNVNIFHDEGYQLQTAQLHLDFSKNMAWSDQDVRVLGPRGTIEAKGLQANGKEELIVFHGPAKMIIKRENNEIGDVFDSNFGLSGGDVQ